MDVGDRNGENWTASSFIIYTLLWTSLDRQKNKNEKVGALIMDGMCGK